MIKIKAAGKKPTKKTKGAAGYDIHAAKGGRVPAKGSVVVSTGVSLEMSANVACKVESRSGMGFSHDVAAFPGVVDSDYSGEVMVKLFNHGQNDYIFHCGDSIAQLVFVNVLEADGDVLHVDDERNGGFGSTGK